MPIISKRTEYKPVGTFAVVLAGTEKKITGNQVWIKTSGNRRLESAGLDTLKEPSPLPFI